jgi:hypothetical protein
MPNLTEILTAGGILRAAEVVEIAQAAKLDVACAAVLLAKESGGGANVWGRDPVPTGGAYTPGGPVTQDNYRAYRDAVLSGKAGRNGVGPTQLTYGPLQARADDLGGCWDWRVNCRVGFEHLAGLIRANGVRDGFRRFNGSGSAAERYADDAMAKLAVWQRRIAVAPVKPTPPSGAAALPTLTHGMRGNTSVKHLQAFLASRYPLYAGDLPATGNYLDGTAAAVREFQKRMRVTNADGSTPDGRTVGARTNTALWAEGYRG